MSRLWALALILLWPVAALAQPAPETVIGALSQDEVAITANFSGSEIFIYGAVRREAPVPLEAGPLHVVITVQGPSQALQVRRKERTFGIWVNRDTAVVDEAPSFYAIATTAPLTEIMSETERLRYRIGFDRVVRIVGASPAVANPENFADAVVRIRRKNDLYSQLEGIVDLRQETLFSTHVALPANLVEGDYLTRMYLLRNREVVSVAETAIEVRKTGLERLIYTMAHERPLLYGILSILVALAAGWGASELFRQLRR